MADEDQSVENMRANKRLKLTNTEQDLSMFRNVRFSSDELPTQPMDIYTPASLENSGSSVHDLSHHDPNPQSDNKAEAIIDTDSDITSPLTKTLEQNAITRPVEFNDALSYVDQVKARFKDQLEIYEAFLKILQAYQKERKTSVDLYDQITKLFQSAPDLVQGFEAFLPPDHYTQLDSFHQAQIQTAVAAVDDDYDDEKGLRKRKR
jgi:histone deacetylase complex regulatory component SIN3